LTKSIPSAEPLDASQGRSQGRWWPIGLVFGLAFGPAVVVVAGLITAWIAYDGADVPLPRNHDSVKSVGAPAMEARNHAATHTAGSMVKP
jgi:hypothetical protein